MQRYRGRHKCFYLMAKQKLLCPAHPVSMQRPQHVGRPSACILWEEQHVDGVDNRTTNHYFHIDALPGLDSRHPHFLLVSGASSLQSGAQLDLSQVATCGDHHQSFPQYKKTGLRSTRRQIDRSARAASLL
ncbi:uncharacterized protein LOC118319617 isoform X3 [Scophthalmus maximus]|uniref:uncharacterized protein LOC118319617 isoform X3 n=1 Tax=Scophthalmus maximus TaxID=52904 RepID=UPI001FA8B9A8|nr:uncharacterized protein LOC118319617 isoform X3 [Scophthalmus maximus]